MNKNSYTIDQRIYTFAESPFDIKLDSDKNYLFELPYLSLLTIQGDNASSFLQGQLTCDMRDINETTMRQAALCNLKGRILALLDVFLWQNYHLLLPKDLRQETENSLAKTALFSKVTLHENNSCKIYGFLLNNTADLLPLQLALPHEIYALKSNENFCAYALGDNFYILLIQKAFLEDVTTVFKEAQQYLSFAEWHALQLNRLKAEIYPLSRGVFLPHRLELHTQNYISFTKGCYKGQEIIARSHYLATLKHALNLFLIQAQVQLRPGMKIFSSQDPKKEIGEIIDYCPLSSDNYLILASVLKELSEAVILEGKNEAIVLNQWMPPA